jgi:hypothetical protein
MFQAETKLPAPGPAPTPEQLAVHICNEYAAILSEEQTGNHKLVERAIKVGEKLIYCKNSLNALSRSGRNSSTAKAKLLMAIGSRG